MKASTPKVGTQTGGWSAGHLNIFEAQYCFQEMATSFSVKVDYREKVNMT